MDIESIQKEFSVDTSDEKELYWFIMENSEEVFKGEVEEHRWVVYQDVVVKSPSGKFFCIITGIGRGEESLEDYGFDYADELFKMHEVFPKEVTTTTYE
jgi:hypothetical protein